VGNHVAALQQGGQMGEYFGLNGRPYQQLVAMGELATANLQPCIYQCLPQH